MVAHSRTLLAAALGWCARGEPPSEPFMVFAPMAESDSNTLDVFHQQTAFTNTAPELKHDSHAHVNGHLLIVRNPKNRFSVVEPLPDKCGSVQLVNKTAHLHKPRCIFATDAGYYDLHEDNLFGCIGNVVSDGEIGNTAPLNESNVNFGVHKNGSWVIGYISPEQVKAGEFTQLVAGLGWIVRDGKNYVDEGWKEAYTAAGASGDEYVSMTSGRTAVGWNAKGELIILQYDGHTHEPSWGATMNELADKLIFFGVVQAINLDGGGSTQMWKNGEQVGYSSDRAVWGILEGTYDPGCPVGGKDNMSAFECSRMVSTILCVHEDPEFDTEGGGMGGDAASIGGVPLLPSLVILVVGLAAGAGLSMLFGGRGNKYDEQDDDSE